MIIDTIVNGLIAVTGALMAVAYQYWQFRKEVKQSASERVAQEKRKVIEALVAYRFVLTPGENKDIAAVSAFNAALSSIPIYFSHNKKIIDAYRAFGNGFTPEKYYDFIILLLKDVPVNASTIDKHLLESVPSVKKGV